MANPNYSWRDRKWKLFEKTYSSNPIFKVELDKLWTNKSKTELANDTTFENLLGEYDIPRICMFAVLEFLANPDLEREHYLSYLIPPILFWNPKIKELGPSMGIPAKEWLALSLKKSGLDSKLNDKDITRLMEAVSGNYTVMAISPYLKKSELLAIINEYFDELQPYLDSRSDKADFIHSKKALYNVHSAETKNVSERNKIIIKLLTEGKTYKEIQNYLDFETNYSAPSADYLRVIKARYISNLDS